MKVEGGISANTMGLSSIVGHLRLKIESSVAAVQDQDYWPKRTELLCQKQNAKGIPFPDVEPPRNHNL